jgi:ABC-type multidrug transport system fused ATPase/permease subunit
MVQSLMLVGFLQYAVRLISEVENAVTSIERIVQYSDLTPEAAYRLPAPATVGPATTTKGGEARWPSRGALCIEGLQMRFRPELPLTLQGLDLDIQAGEKVGIVGRTGAGKSSLVSCLFRLVEVSML